MEKPTKNNISLAGEFSVLMQLALRDYDASLTLGHTKSVDILVANSSTEKMCKVEVKTRIDHEPTDSKLFGNGLDWPMSLKHESIIAPNLFYVFVSIEKEAHSFRFFIVPSRVVAKYLTESHKYWWDNGIKEGKTLSKENALRKFRIGLDDTQARYPKEVYTPLAKEYEDNWEQLTK
jgi:hypothetical protein